MEDLINVMIADDKDVFRHVIKEVLEPFPVSLMGEATNGKELLELLEKKQPDIVLLDLEMPVLDGNKTFDLIRKKFPAVKIIVLSLYYEAVLIENYIERGAKGYIPKHAVEPNMLINALRQVKNNGIFVYEKPSDNPDFSTRQKEIMTLIFEGLTNDEIAGEIAISTRAVEKQRHKIYDKSGVKKIIDFYKYAFSRGLQFLGRRKKRAKSLRHNVT
jgi:DNA-binding NarL/FixJ family response regulator